MNIKTSLLEQYVNFVDNTKKQNNDFQLLFLIAINMFLFLVYLKILQSNIRTIIRIQVWEYMSLYNIKFINE